MLSADQLLRDAARLLREGKVEEAIDAHERLLGVRPDLADAWFNLAWLQRSDRRFEAALASYAQAIERGVRGPEEAHLNRAVILSEHLERAPEAEGELRKAIAANPRFVPAWLNLGNLYEDWGDAEKARDAYMRVLAIEPRNGRALARLATVDQFRGEAAAVVTRLLRVLANPAPLPADDAAEVGFALGNALDAVGRYDEAFAAFERANRAALDAAPPGSRYRPEATERLVDALVQAFPEPVTSEPSPEPPPIFICGMFRSGSTLAERILGRHSEVTPGGELDFLADLVATRLQPYPEAATMLSTEGLRALGEDYLRSVRALLPAGTVVTDKRPDNFLHIGLIKAMFPDARVVHTRRDPLDNLLSIYSLYFHHNISYGFDLDDLVHWYRNYARLMRHWRSLYPDSIHDFDYDAAVRDPWGEVERLLAFCGLPWEEACLAPGEASGTVRTASAWQVRQPIHARSSGRWRNYEAQLGHLRAALDGP